MTLPFNCNLGYHQGPFQNFQGPHVPHFGGAGPTMNYNRSAPEEEREEEREEDEDVEEDDGEGVPVDDKWMDWDSQGNPRNPRFHRKFAGFLGKVGRRHVPISYTNWKTFGKENPRTTDKMWQQIKVESW